MAGITTLSSAIIVNNDWVKDAKNQDQLRRFLRASQRGWEYTFDNRDEAAEIFMKHAPAFNMEIALLEINGTHDDHPTPSTPRASRSSGRPSEDWQESQDLAGEVRQADARSRTSTTTTPTSILSQPPYTAGKK